MSPVPGTGGKDLADPRVAEILDGVATAMGVTHRTGDLEEEVAKIAAELAPAEPEAEAENTEENKES